MNCCDTLGALGYHPWSPIDAYWQNQGVSRPDGIYILSIATPDSAYTSDCAPGPGNPNWSGPFTVENLNRKLNNEKANTP